MKAPPFGGTVTSITSPQEGDYLSTTFTAVGTFDGITPPTVTYYPDRDDANTSHNGTVSCSRNGTWEASFANVSPSNDNRGRVSADSVYVDKLTVK